MLSSRRVVPTLAATMRIVPAPAVPAGVGADGERAGPGRPGRREPFRLHGGNIIEADGATAREGHLHQRLEGVHVAGPLLPRLVRGAEPGTDERRVLALLGRQGGVAARHPEAG